MIESINRLSDTLLKKLLLYRVWLFLIIGLLLILGIIAIVLKENAAKKPSEDQMVLSQLKQIEFSLHQTKNLTDQHENTELSNLKSMGEQLHGIQADLALLGSKSNTQEIQAIIVKENKQISDQILALDKQVRQLNRQNKINKFLPASVLPFKVLSVDIWNGEMQATVMVHRVSDLMARGDTRSGWELVDLSFSPAHAVFKNTKNQLVRVRLTGTD